MYAQNIDSLIYTKASFSTSLLQSPNGKAEIVCSINYMDTIGVYTDYFERPYLKIKYKDQIGYLSLAAVEFNDEVEDFINSRNGSTTFKNKSKSSSSRTSSSYRRQNRTYFNGPRGGCYYIDSNGKKIYVDKSLCK